MLKSPRLWHFLFVVAAMSIGSRALSQTTYTNVCTGQVVPGATGPGYTDWNGTDQLVCNDARTPTVSGNSAGITGWRYCKTQWGNFGIQWTAATWQQIYEIPGLLPALATSGGTAATNEKINQLAQQFKASKLPLAHESLKPVWCPQWSAMLAGRPLPERPQCGVENQDCVLPAGVTATVFYGAQHSYVSKPEVTNRIACTTTAFGSDPLSGTPKTCAYVVTATSTPPPTPIPTVGRVAANGTATTRPAYTVTSGVRSKSAHPTVRAPVNAPCVPSVLKVVDAGFEYSAWLISQATATVAAVTSAPLVTSCTK